MIAKMIGGSGRIDTCSEMKGKQSLEPPNPLTVFFATKIWTLRIFSFNMSLPVGKTARIGLCRSFLKVKLCRSV